MPVAPARVENIGDEQPAYSLQRLRQWAAQSLRARRQLHAGADTDQQGIVENITQAKGDNVTKAGLRYDNDYCMIWRVENGRITMIKEYCDSALVERELGPFPEEKALASV